MVFDGEHTVSQKLAIDNNIDANIVTCAEHVKNICNDRLANRIRFGRVEIINAMSKIQGQATSCANSIGQVASIEALDRNQSTVDQYD